MICYLPLSVLTKSAIVLKSVMVDAIVRKVGIRDRVNLQQ